MYVDDIIKNGWKEAEYGSVWKQLMNNVDIGEPASFLDHENLGCTQRECKPNETIVEQYKKMFESRIYAGDKQKNYWDGKNLKHKQ